MATGPVRDDGSMVTGMPLWMAAVRVPSWGSGEVRVTDGLTSEPGEVKVMEGPTSDPTPSSAAGTSKVTEGGRKVELASAVDTDG
jgi:hypothetical protein